MDAYLIREDEVLDVYYPSGRVAPLNPVTVVLPIDNDIPVRVAVKEAIEDIEAFGIGQDDPDEETMFVLYHWCKLQFGSDFAYHINLPKERNDIYELVIEIFKKYDWYEYCDIGE